MMTFEQLIDNWRRDATANEQYAKSAACDDPDDKREARLQAGTLRQCANELESALKDDEHPNRA